VIGIAEVRLPPLQRLHSSVRSLPRLSRSGADDGVLAIGFVPHWHHQYSGFGSLNAGPELGARLMRKAVPHTNRKSAE
jgi:hypothetical protein